MKRDILPLLKRYNRKQKKTQIQEMFIKIVVAGECL